MEENTQENTQETTEETSKYILEYMGKKLQDDVFSYHEEAKGICTTLNSCARQSGMQPEFKVVSI